MNECEEKFTLLYIQRAQKKKDLVFICTRTVIPKGAPLTYTNNCHLVKIFPFCNLSATKRKIPSGCCTVKLQLLFAIPSIKFICVTKYHHNHGIIIIIIISVNKIDVSCSVLNSHITNRVIVE